MPLIEADVKLTCLCPFIDIEARSTDNILWCLHAGMGFDSFQGRTVAFGKEKHGGS